MAASRRMFIAIASAAGLGGVVLAYRNSTGETPGDVDARLRDYEAYLAAVAADYRAGRLAVVDRWIVSTSEADAHPEAQSGASTR